MRINSPKICTTIWLKGTGLMFRFPKKPFAFVFPFTKSQPIMITMFFVFYPIDVVVYDERSVVTALYKGIKPFSHQKIYGSGFVELAAGTIESEGLAVGQTVQYAKKALIIK